jgi:hypothetical protein
MPKPAMGNTSYFLALLMNEDPLVAPRGLRPDRRLFITDGRSRPLPDNVNE